MGSPGTQKLGAARQDPPAATAKLPKPSSGIPELHPQTGMPARVLGKPGHSLHLPEPCPSLAAPAGGLHLSHAVMLPGLIAAS